MSAIGGGIEPSDTTEVPVPAVALGRPGHLVHFHDSDESLSEVLSRFVAEGLRAKESVLLIITPAHRRLLEARLRHKGVDPAASDIVPRLRWYDAQDTLAKLMVESMPSAPLFQAALAEVMAEARGHAENGKIRAFGEMVDLLWKADNTRAAVRLEELWNDLQRREGFSLLCAYTMGSFFTQAADVRRVSAAHDQAIGLGAEYPDTPYARALVAEISQRKEIEASLQSTVRELDEQEHWRTAAAARTERLMRITAAIADAVTEEQVLHAVVDEVTAALGASSGGLWMVEEGARVAVLRRAVGYNQKSRPALASVSLEEAGRFPISDAIREGEPLFIPSQSELLQTYPHLRPLVTAGRDYRITCLPIVSRGQSIGGLGLTFDDAPPIGSEQRDFLMLVTRYAGQALERLRLYVEHQQGRVRAELLYGLVRQVIEARSVDEVLEPALDTIERALLAERCSILICDEQGVMRFRAWRGLSPEYRAAVDGHSPWRREDPNPQAILVPDVSQEPSLAAYRPLFEEERIGSLAFFPLVAGGELVGKFMVYYQTPRVLGAQEVEMAKAIASHVAAACARFASLAELEKTVRFNEMFTGILGHDLRNPLAAIMAAAEVAQKRGEEASRSKPLTRILTSGKRMARMIDQLLDFTRVRVGGGVPLEPRAADLMLVVRQVADELVQAHPDRCILLHEQGQGEGFWDVDRLSQVFSNLVGNAIQHGDAQHPVRVRMDGSSATEVRLEVQNNGVVPPDRLGRLFEPMGGGDRRGDGSNGLGLGLFISAQIVRAHGGRIAVQSDPAAGTIFSVTLPRAAGT